MPITSEQREQRRGYLGSSDAAAVLGLSKWGNPYDVWWSKVYEEEDRQTRQQAAGTEAEKYIAIWTADRLGVRFSHDVTYIAENGVMAANLDACFEDEDKHIIPVEIKCRLSRDERWGSPNRPGKITDKIPLHEMIQSLHQMICTNAPYAYVAVFLYDRLELRIYRIERSEVEVYLSALERKLLGWWQAHVVAGKPPKGTPRYETVWNTVRTPDQTCPVPPHKVARMERAAALARRAERLKKRTRASLLKHMGDSTVGIAGDRRVFVEKDAANRTRIKVEDNQ